MNSLCITIFKVVCKILIVFLVILLTTYGWHPSKKYVVKLTSAEQGTEQRLKKTVFTIVESFGVRNYQHYANLSKTADYIYEQFRMMDYQPVTMTYKIDGVEFQNIVVEKTAADPKAETIIVGAHYDSCFNPGANDNASGIAALLEIARLLKDETLQINLKFIAFVNEEPPFYLSDDMGSRQYAIQAKKAKEKIEGVIIFDLIGYYKDAKFSQRYFPFMGPFYSNRANFIAVIANFPSYKWGKNIVRAFQKSSNFPIESCVAPSFLPGISFSDHWSFWQEGYNAVLITDTAFMRSPHYHSDSDLPETLDYGRLAKVVHAMKQVIVDLSSK